VFSSVVDLFIRGLLVCMLCRSRHTSSAGGFSRPSQTSNGSWKILAKVLFQQIPEPFFVMILQQQMVLQTAEVEAHDVLPYLLTVKVLR